jgi:transposase
MKPELQPKLLRVLEDHKIRRVGGEESIQVNFRVIAATNRPLPAGKAAGSAGAIASHVGGAPRLRQSDKKRFSASPTIPFGNARLRKALWMVVLNAVRCNPWLRQYYERLRAAGKPGKVAVIAAMRKLLTAVWSVATHRKPAVPHFPEVPAPVGAVTNKA